MSLSIRLATKCATSGLLLLALIGRARAQTVNISVDANANRHAISPLVYGIAFGDPLEMYELNIPLNRYGGDNTSRYNWFENCDNRGNDFYYESIPDPSNVAGERADTFIANDIAVGSVSMFTIPMIGWVGTLGSNRNKICSFSVAKYGPQTGDDWQYYPDAGNGISSATNQFISGNAFTDANIPSNTRFQESFVQHLVTKWGAAANGGLQYYMLDNEPSLWYGTHRDVHPNGAGMNEVYNDTVAYAGMIKGVDPTAQIVGPEEWGWSGYFYSGMDQQYGNTNGWGNLNALPDRAAHGGWDYMPWLLNSLYQHDQATGSKSLDVFSLHFYPQGGEYAGGTDPATTALRNRSTRQLWDPNYVSESWINAPVYLIPRMKQWVSTYYPGLKVALTEYNWGAEDQINGATTQADILGIFGREAIDMACRWAGPDPGGLTYNSFMMYRNYDGNASTYGDVSISDQVPNPDEVSSFASVRTSDGALTIMAINKDQNDAFPIAINIANYPIGGAAQPWQLTTSNVITQNPSITITGGVLNDTLPAQSITLYVIPAPAVKLIGLTGPAAAIPGGQTVNGAVTLSGTFPAGVAVSLSSSIPAATVPATVTVPSGSTQATFSIATSAVYATTSGSITASYNGTKLSAPITVRPVGVAALDIKPTLKVTGGGTRTGIVTLEAAAGGAGVIVTLSSASPVARVPDVVVVPTGSTTASFTITTSVVTTSTVAVIEAAANGIHHYKNLTVAPK